MMSVVVCAIARGAHLAAIRSHGLKLIVEGQTRTVDLPASDDPATFGPQDVVICALKAQQAHASAGAFAPLLGPRTAVLTAMNGIPWWYFYKERGPLDGHHLESVDPGAAQWNAIGPERALGCVVDPACEVVAPGVIEHRLFKRFTIGEPDGSTSDRIVALRDALVSAGFDSPGDNFIARTHHSRTNDGEATERGRFRRRSQNFHAARSRKRPVPRDRCTRHRRPGNGPPCQYRNTNDRHGACVGTGTWAAGWTLYRSTCHRGDTAP